jgi:hypothetical protein
MYLFVIEIFMFTVNLWAQKVRRPMLSNRYKQRYVVVNVKRSASVMKWGCLCRNGGRDSLYFLPPPPKTTMNGGRFMAMLKEKLVFWMDHHKATHYLDNGAPCHKSKKVMEFLKGQKFSLIDWLGNLPDLNPIENLWSIIKGKIKTKENIAALPQFIKAIKEIWVTLPKPLMVKLAHSMQTRIQKCLENVSQMTKY